MSTKRRPEKDLNHDNWNEEDEPEEQGEFVKADEEELKKRKILQPKRKLDGTSPAAGNPFGGLSLTTAATPAVVPTLSTDSTNGSKVVSNKEISLTNTDTKAKAEEAGKSSEDEDDLNGENSESDSSLSDEDSSSSSAVDGAVIGEVAPVNNIDNSESDEDLDSDDDIDEEEDGDGDGSGSDENASDGDE